MIEESKMIKIRERRSLSKLITGVLVMFALIITMSAQPVRAADSHPVTVHFGMAENSSGSVSFDVYKIGTYSESGVKLDSPFDESNVNIVLSEDGTSNNEQLESAATLYQYIKDKKVGEDSVQKISTGANGSITFTGEVGSVYLVGTESTIVSGGKEYSANPMFVVVSENEDEEIEAKPAENTGDKKHNVNTGTLEVIKHWSGDTVKMRPDSIEVEIYEDNVLKETVTLNAANNWTYEWKDEDQEGNWTCIEKVPEGYAYTVASTSDGMKDQRIITNSPDKTTPPKTTDDKIKGKNKKKSNTDKKKTSTSRAARTGDPTTYRWAIIAMALSGFALIVVALRRRKEE